MWTATANTKSSVELPRGEANAKETRSLLNFDLLYDVFPSMRAMVSLLLSEWRFFISPRNATSVDNFKFRVYAIT